MPDWSINAPTLEADEKALVRLVSFLSDLRPFWPAVRTLFISWMSRQFDSQGEYFGEGWAALSIDYQAWKSQVFPGKGILSAEGDLRKAATSPRSIPTPLTLTLFIDEYTKTGSKVAGWAGKKMDPLWFQDGTGQMPARHLIFEELPPADAMAELQIAAREYAEMIITKSGLR